MGIAFPGLEVPAFAGTHPIYAAALWVGGVNEEDELKINYLKYCQDSLDNCTENWGPLKLDGSLSTTEEIEPYNTIHFLTQPQIDAHRDYFECVNNPGCDAETNFPNFQISPQILNWPAESEENSGFATNLAPFYDSNGNGTYDPENGDYPLFCGDFATYHIWNGRGSINSPPLGHRMDVEIHTSIYGYDPEQNSEFHTLFVQHKIINRGTETYSNTFTGFWVDFDLGNYLDDHVGTDVERSMFYALNADEFDESGVSGPGYGSNLPMMGVKVLGGPWMDSDGQDNSPTYEALYANETTGFGDGIIDNERLGLYSSIYTQNSVGPSATQDPVSPIQHYNLMRAIWRNGSPMKYLGIGFTPQSIGVQTKYVFPGLSDPLNAGTNGFDPNYPTEGGWTEANENIEGGDRRMIGSSGPFTFEPGDVQYIDLAYIFARESHSEEETVLETLQRYADEIEGMHCEPLPLIVLSDESVPVPERLTVYPNPAREEISFDLPLSSATMTIFDITGKEIRQKFLQGGNQRIDVQNLETGVYLIRVESGSSIYHGKFVIKK
jgi:hypothetical protein